MELEAFREQQWVNRLSGYWFWNTKKKKATYITGLHWFYLEWYFMGSDHNSGYPDYRDPDRKFFYFLDNVVNNPKCYGLVYVTKRRQGKTQKSAVFALDAVTRMKFANAGIQSKSAPDASDVVFRDGIIRAFQRLPHFFMPKYDTSAGISPKTELRFMRASKRGAQFHLEQDDYLGGWIDWRAGSEIAYDGTKLKRYIGDELFKTPRDVDIYERWRVVKFCLQVDGKIYGKAFHTSTVEEIEGATETYIKFWNDSNQDELDPNTGQTKTGLYRYYLPADQSRNFDKYGMCDEAMNRKQILAERAMYADDHIEYNSLVRKESLTIEEAFRVVSTSNTFDTTLINNRLDVVSWQEDKLVEEGEFVLDYHGGSVLLTDEITNDHSVRWVTKKGGKFKRMKHFNHPEGDKLFRVDHHGSVIPLAKDRFRSGNDPYDHGSGQNRRHQSNGAFYIYAKYDPMNPETTGTFVLEYINRPKTVEELYDDYMMALMYYGCQGLVENNRIGLIQYFRRKNLSPLLVWIPGRKEPGIPGHRKTIDAISNVTERHIVEDIDKLVFVRLMKDWLSFNPDDTKKYDAAMAAGYTLLADRDFYIGKPAPPKKSRRVITLKDIFG